MHRNYSLGFTLIELMLVVAIIAIISAISYPSYTQYVTGSYRDTAKGDLASLAVEMESYRSKRASYSSASPATISEKFDYSSSPIQRKINGVTVTETTGIARYNFSIVTTSSQAFTLKASPVSGGSQDGDGFIMLFSTEVKCISTVDDDDCDVSDDTW